MAIYSYTNSGINFYNIDSAPTTKLSIPGKLVSNQNDFEYPEDGIKPVVNAIEIDWNKADLGNSYYINTTGELLSYLSSINTKIDNLVSILSEL